MIRNARHVLIAAGKTSQADMVAACLAVAPARFSLPAGQISAAGGAEVEWLLTQAIIYF